MKGIENREQRIRISTYQKSCIVKFSVPYSLFLSLCAALKGVISCDAKTLNARFVRVYSIPVF